ncbi:SDR family oxidoreductase [Rhodopseudomonas sp. HC1]|uniref:SDR family NAD(P)-dependent oxidoreductase n=1 Tax=Rhodopseudomonas infernalis TaxID=2897386 RepID=UPI001EE85D06|nr:SDR family oxidoreductase [Rhodopseudomonas infernalis]MCG6203610.1 SDR family oxidoreductase [Rhodopseudomonas infernalis]
MSTPFDLTDQTILVSGAAGGIGYAAAVALATQGARVVLCDRRPIEDERLRRLGARATFAVCDVTSRSGVEDLHSAFPKVDGLVLAAGILPFDNWMDDDWDQSFDRVMAVNVRGCINLVRAYFPGMCERRSGRVVFVGSASGRMGGMQAGPHYAASKGAVHSLVRWYAKRAAPLGVCVNGVAPGSIATEMLDGQPFDAARVPMRRMGTVDEVAWPIAFLCSPAAGYMNGAVIDINGGLVFS